MTVTSMAPNLDFVGVTVVAALALVVGDGEAVVPELEPVVEVDF